MNYFFIAIAVFLSAGLLLWQLSTDNASDIPAQTQYLDWFGKDITLTEINPDGRTTRTLTTQTLKHYMPDNTTDLAQVNLHMLPTEDQPHEWFLSSDKGRLLHAEKRQDITRVDLWHNVQLLRPENEHDTAVTMNTATIAIFPEKEYAHTDQYTIVNQMGNQMSGVGMEIFFPTQEFYLIDDVSSFHENAG